MVINYLYLPSKKKFSRKNDFNMTPEGGGHAGFEKGPDESRSILGNRTSGTRFSNSIYKKMDNSTT